MEAAKQAVAVVRAIPYPPHKRRWCGLERWVADTEKRPQQEMQEQPGGGFRPVFDVNGKPVYAKHALPWPDTEVKVFVVDEPAPFDPKANGGVPVEISPATFAMLEGDPRISARMLDGGVDAAEAVRVKAQAAKLEGELHVARKDLADAAEAISRQHAVSQEQAEEAGKRIAALEHELAQARAQIAGRKK